MKDLFSVVTVQEAQSLITDKMAELFAGVEQVALLEALNRRLAEDVFAPEDLPPFTRSTVDGYAVRAKDTFGVSENMPGFLNVTGEIEMGKQAVLEIGPGLTAWVPTGGMLPRGADAVVMVEYTEQVGAQLITVNHPVTVGQNLINRGEDCAKGALLLRKGIRLRPAEIGLLAALGLTKIQVVKKAKVGIISTGDEIVRPEEVPAPGQIRDINTYTLAAQVVQNGGTPSCYGIVKDDADELTKVLARAVEENDLVLLSGGSSVGTRDMTAAVLAASTPGIIFHGLAIKPGKPTIGAFVGTTPVFGLPGHPASALVVFRALVTPLLEWGSYRWAAENADFPVKAELSQSLASGPGREDYLRVKLTGKGERLIAVPVLGKSGLISTLTEADGLVRIPLAKEGLNGGSPVMVAKL